MSEQPTSAATGVQARVEQTPQELAARVAGLRANAVKGKRRLASSVLAMEFVVFWLAIIVAVVMSHVSLAAAVPVGAALALGCAVVAARIKRPWALRAGWVLQVLAVACGFVVPTMFIVGPIFLLLWFAALRVADSAMKVANDYAASVADRLPDDQ